jgi:hypothetical protein
VKYLLWAVPEHLDIQLVLPPGTDHALEGLYFDTDEADGEAHRKFQVLLDDVRESVVKRARGAS